MDIVYFELNNWFLSIDYPNEYPIKQWVENSNDFLCNESWIKQNELCVNLYHLDLSLNWCITAKKEWVVKNCPDLISKYSSYIKKPGIDGKVYGRLDCEFLPYIPQNIGLFIIEDGVMENLRKKEFKCGSNPDLCKNSLACPCSQYIADAATKYEKFLKSEFWQKLVNLLK